MSTAYLDICTATEDRTIFMQRHHALNMLAHIEDGEYPETKVERPAYRAIEFEVLPGKVLCVWSETEDTDKGDLYATADRIAKKLEGSV